MLVREDGSFRGTVGGGELESRVLRAAQDALQTGKAEILHYNMTDPARGDPGLCGGQLDVYLEPLLPAPQMLIIGGGHVGRAAAHLAKWMGFRVLLSDDRPEFCTPAQNPDADAFYPTAMQNLPAQIPLGRQTYIVLATRGAEVDIAGLPPLLKSKAAYIGVIGSKKRWAATKAGLTEAGLSPEEIARAQAPIGLEIHAETPEEIAISILAEITLLRRAKN